MYIVMHRRYL